jgi:hypothetical protein
MRDARAVDDTRIPAACDPASVLDHYREPAPARRYRAFNAGAGLDDRSIHSVVVCALSNKKLWLLLCVDDEFAQNERTLHRTLGAGGVPSLRSCSADLDARARVGPDIAIGGVPQCF